MGFSFQIYGRQGEERKPSIKQTWDARAGGHVIFEAGFLGGEQIVGLAADLRTRTNACLRA